jgi:hypothetical protein
LRAANDEFVHVTPEQSTVDIDAIRVARHGINLAGAQRLVEWFLVNRPVRIEGRDDRKNVGNAGWRDEDARLASRACRLPLTKIGRIYW